MQSTIRSILFISYLEFLRLGQAPSSLKPPGAQASRAFGPDQDKYSIRIPLFSPIHLGDPFKEPMTRPIGFTHAAPRKFQACASNR